MPHQIIRPPRRPRPPAVEMPPSFHLFIGGTTFKVLLHCCTGTPSSQVRKRHSLPLSPKLIWQRLRVQQRNKIQTKRGRHLDPSECFQVVNASDMHLTCQIDIRDRKMMQGESASIDLFFLFHSLTCRSMCVLHLRRSLMHPLDRLREITGLIQHASKKSRTAVYLRRVGSSRDSSRVLG